MNMQVLEKSRRRPLPGDIFVYKMPDDRFRFGRVVRMDAVIGAFQGCTMVYLYRPSSPSPLPVPVLRPTELIVPPEITNLQPWLRGYFQTVEHRQLTQEDMLPVDCFYSPTFRRYYDADDNILPERSEPCGIHALSSYRTIDDAISEALGIPLAPD